MSPVLVGEGRAVAAIALATGPVFACQFSSSTGAAPGADTGEGSSTTALVEPGDESTRSSEAASEADGDGSTSGAVALDTTSGVLDTTTATDGSSSDDGTTTVLEGESSSTGDGIVTTLYCDAPGLAIPDNAASGVATQIVVPDSAVVLGVRVRLDITHTHVGDLRLDLRHGDADRLIMSYPGGGTCSGDDILARLVDDAGTPVQTACTADTPALAGDLQPEFSLDVFVGMGTLGAWELRATDGGPADTGTIAVWCLEIDHLP